MTDEASRLRQSHFGSGFDAGRASRDAEVARLRTALERLVTLADDDGSAPTTAWKEAFEAARAALEGSTA